MKRGQIDIVVFVGLIVGLMILAPFMLKIVNSILDPLTTQLNQTSTTAGANVSYVHETFIDFWDWVIAVAFLVNLIALIVFAFLVESHPIFSLFYFISAIITLSFSHAVLAPVTIIFGMSEFSTEVLQLPITGYLVNFFDIILLAIIIITGVIMYGKFSGGGLQR